MLNKKILNLILFILITSPLQLYSGPLKDLPVGDMDGLGGFFGDKEEKKDNKQEAPKADQKGKKGIDINKLMELATDEDTIEEEMAAGLLYSSKLLGAVKVLKDDKKQNYINKVGRHIANQSERKDLPWTFAIVDTDSINAFAAPGGYIFITKGLFNVLGSEDELAAVLAHECAHVLRKHQYQVIKDQKMIQFATESFSSMSDNAMMDKMSGMIGQIMARGLDQTAEFQADKDGLVLAARAGYDASAILKVLDKLNALNKRNDSAMAFMTSTHPTPADRQLKLADYASDEVVNYSVLSKYSKRIGEYQK